MVVDLGQLVVDRQRPMLRRPSRWGARIVLPMVLLASFAGLFAWSARDALLPARSVTVIPVVVARSDVTTANAPLFQAAGWVEPRPSAVVVTALAEGVVDRLIVVEGQEIKPGEPVAYLLDRDARIGLAESVAAVELQKAELASANARLAAAKAIAAEPIQRQAELADAEAQLAKIRTELGRLPHQIEISKSRLAYAELDFASKGRSSDVISNLAYERSRSELNIAKSTLAEQQGQLAALRDEASALARRRDVLGRQLLLKTEETRQVAEAAAAVQAATAKVRQAELANEAARIRLDRMVVRAATAGRILAVVAHPGGKVMGMAPGTMLDASTVVTMYDPNRLQIRADVRLEDVPRVLPGQKVRIETAAAPEGLEGHVLAATSFADIQKNTLQVKVAIDAPPPVLRPDMLVQVTFLAMERPSSRAVENSAMRIFVPRSLVVAPGNSASIWVADMSSSVARIKSIKTGAAMVGDLVEAVEGLSVGDKLIVSGREQLRVGDRIRIVGEDDSFGKSPVPSPPQNGAAKHQHGSG